MYLIFDTETTGIPHNRTAPITDLENWPRLVQLAWQLHDPKGKLLSRHSFIIKPEGFNIPFKAQQVHGISTERAEAEGHDLQHVLKLFQSDAEQATWLIGHNIEFDINIIGAEFIRKGMDPQLLLSRTKLDTGVASTEFCQLSGGVGGKLKMPRLTELHEKLFGKPVQDAHDAAYDVAATARCFFGLIHQGIISPADNTQTRDIHYEEPELGQSNFSKIKEVTTGPTDLKSDNRLAEETFFHVHVHSQFSLLQATADIDRLVQTARQYQMPALALTDLGNMYGAFAFVRSALQHGIKPIVGCEFFIAEERKKLKFTKDNPDKRYNQVLLAKNKTGYHNLARLSSLGFTEGLYGIYPRIDKELIKKHREGLIALSGGLNSEIPWLILHVGDSQAEKALLWWVELFGDDFYIELNRHGLPEEDHVNKVLLQFAEKHNIKYIAANECFYIDRAEAKAQDILVCIGENEKITTPKGHGRGHRYGLPNDMYYFKSQEEMKDLFRDLPEAIKNLEEILAKTETYSLERPVVLPRFPIPAGFSSEIDYLRHLTYEGAKKRYSEITQAIQERLDFELEIIQKTGYPGYFLIVQDITSTARKMGVSVGPGRGSAAGSAVAYCIGITNIDPIKYDLLFERFLNPDRTSLPDIDIDFDDEGREKVLQYVIEKYGREQVAQIITYGTMAARSAIRNCARVLDLPLSDANNLAKLVPEKPGTTLEKAFAEIPELSKLRKGEGLAAEVLQNAQVIEGLIRNTGIHACGVIITPEPLTSLVPVTVVKDSDMLATQFDNSVVESAGLLKMDFLGLTTLSIIKTALTNIRQSRGIEIDIDNIPLDDEKTYRLYQRGETNGTFQFESPGMQKYLRALKPDKFEDLIAMNALYRPGPMEYIPHFINRKHGIEKITYDLPEMEEFLAETYGITVYQEQVMLLSQKLAGFSKGDADVLRKAMGKKQKSVLDKMKDKFLEGCKSNGHPVEVCEKIWSDWEAFAQYAFNKSHSTCYSLVAYQTAYLKAHYPAEYMAAVLTHSKDNIDKITFFLEECRNLDIKVLGPHINESQEHFAVNKNGEIRFGLGAIKGAGQAAVESIIRERETNGPFEDIFDFAARVNPRTVNKKIYECLALSGAFDCFAGLHRRQYVYSSNGEPSLIEKALKYAGKAQQQAQSAQTSLFGAATGTSMPKPKVDPVPPFDELEKLNLEKEMLGIYLSGHPLDNFWLEIEIFTNAKCNQLGDLTQWENKDIKLAGIVTSSEQRTTKTGRPFGRFTLEDFSGSFSMTVFGDDYLNLKKYLEKDMVIFLEGTVQRSRFRDEQLEFRVKGISLLSELAAKKIAGVVLKFSVNDINRDTLQELEGLCKKHPGKSALYIYLSDDIAGIRAESISRKYALEVSGPLIRKLQKLGETGILIGQNAVQWLSSRRTPEVFPDLIESGTNSDALVLEEAEF
ncbi:MAG: DNA polymerase III subunit alpha [Cyclobacteriaceae bacterium]|nr:DNA polymerase III subunit alpha [Cyclobacteriaceae bacterium]MCX7637989.1 DNA polymerase III subunit alpha [Cyclobacteriaceae bacterium]MDW8331571.1 DNA polymerase III subunit alpha [Cyclobacteriaceae bacterium]